jgi:tryptophan 7-halogenase
MTMTLLKKKIVVAGGGTAGWMAAAALAKLFGKVCDITLIESDDIGTVGVGEATIPTLHIYHQLLGLTESEVMAATNATFKLGIRFENWREIGEHYLHSFGFLGRDCWAAQFHHFWVKGNFQGEVAPIGDYCLEHFAARQGRFGPDTLSERNHAYHLDATLYARFLRGLAENFGAKRVEGKISRVNLEADSGCIESLLLDSGDLYHGDLFIDCTGFSALLIEKALHTGYDDWSHWLPCDRAVAVQTGSDGVLPPFTRSVAHAAGWQWQIPLQTRTGNGMVFCSRYWSDDEALSTLSAQIGRDFLNTPRIIPFRTGTRRKHWNKNCVAVGLSSGFIEPLESTSIHLIQRNIVRLMLLMGLEKVEQANVDEFNRQAMEEMEHIRDFIVLHYKLTQRDDSEFWRHCKSMNIPETLAHRMAMFEGSGCLYKYDKDLFGESSWVQVMMGQGLMPKSYHPIVNLMGSAEYSSFMAGIKAAVEAGVNKMPLHRDFIRSYCQSRAAI